MTSTTVSRWERGQTSPGPYYRQKLTAVFGLSVQELGLASFEDKRLLQHAATPRVSDAEPVGAPVIVDPAIPLPLPEAASLIGRGEMLHQIKTRLQAGQPPLLLALSGLPGAGKTTLVTAVAHDREVQRLCAAGILWAGLGPHPNIKGHLSRWASLLGVTGLEREDLAELGMAIRTSIATRRLLLCIDDAWIADDALALKVGGPNCMYLLTTRSHLVATTFTSEDVVMVGELDEQGSLELLTQLAPEVMQV